ncbi:MAG TPA: hypothetical protein VK139_08205 [Microbacteriaceae bacterium]|nr:hypothetical protein [Microbacteriaceae bacterium]
MRIRLLVASLLALGISVGAGVPAAQAAGYGSPSFGVSHVWLNGDMDPTVVPMTSWQIDFRGFDSTDRRVITHASAPRFPLIDPAGQSVTHCQAARPTGMSHFGCDVRGTSPLAPGTQTVSVSILEEGVDPNGPPSVLWTGTLPITVCDGICSDLFDVTVDPQPLRFLANSELSTQARGTLVFNVDWNAENVRFSRPVDSSGSVIPGDWEIHTEEPANGSTFSFSGMFTQPGTYTGQLSVGDEFGVQHAASYSIVVCGDEACMNPNAQLATTGASAESGLGLALGAIALGFSAIVRRRWLTVKQSAR